MPEEPLAGGLPGQRQCFMTPPKTAEA